MADLSVLACFQFTDIFTQNEIIAGNRVERGGNVKLYEIKAVYRRNILLDIILQQIQAYQSRGQS
jgi:hypothetical protein